MTSAEKARLAEADAGERPWRSWGPYVAERAWGTVREDYSPDGDAWGFFPHEHARSRAYRWNEDGMAAVCDEDQTFVLGLALWNGVDPILKERMFGLTGPEGNHGEDAKEYWWYLDSTPTHAWMRWRYHYPQREFPYPQLVAESARRTRRDPEFELADTGIFEDGRYWAVTVDYAKAAPHDLCVVIRVENRGPEPATLHVLPSLWFRNSWAWGVPGAGAVPVIRPGASDAELVAEHPAGVVHLDVRRLADPAVLRQRDERSQALRRRRPVGVPEGRHRRPRRPRPADRQPRSPRHEGGPAPRGRGRARRRPGDPAAPGAARAGRRPRRRVRRRGRGAPRGGGRLLRRARPRRADAGGGHGRASGRGRADVGQAVLRVRRRRVAGRRPRGSRAPGAAADRAERGVAARRQRPRHLDARQLGVPLVRGMGPGVPLRRARARRPRLRQGAADPAAAGVVHAPQRADPRLRVGVRRRQPAGARVGRDPGLRDRRPVRITRSWRGSSTSSCSTSRGGSTARTPTAATSSRAASSGSTTSARSTGPQRCRWRPGWSRATALPGWRTTRSTCSRWPSCSPRNTLVRGHGDQVLRALRVHRGSDARQGPVERGATHSSTTCSSFADGPQTAAAGPVDGGPAAAHRRHDARRRPRSTGCPSSRTGSAWFGEHRPQYLDVIGATHERGDGLGRLLAVIDGDRLVRVLRPMLDEAEFLSPYGLRSLSRRHAGAAVQPRARLTRLHRGLRAGRVAARRCSAATPTGAGRCGPRSTTSSSRRCAGTPGSTGRAPGGAPDGLRRPADARRASPTTWRRASSGCSWTTTRAAALCSATSGCSSSTRTGTTC